MEDIMKVIPKLTVTILIVGAMFASTALVRAQQMPAQGGILGAWTLVSEVAHQDGKTTQPLGPNPLGSIMFDRGGRFILMIARPDLPKFAANKRDAGTPEENKAVLAGALAFFGTYTFSEANQMLTLHPEASTFPNWVGVEQKRTCTVSGDEMKWTNRTPAIGAEVVELVWRRAP
jgi:Lipocalin-like domain